MTGRPYDSQRGAALIAALLVVAVAAAVAVKLSERQWLDVQRSQVLLRELQLNEYAFGLEQWATAVLEADLEADRRRGRIDSLEEPWNGALPATVVDEARLSARLADLQGRFNVNNLHLPLDASQQVSTLHAIQLEYFRRLLAVLELDPRLADAVADWLDADGARRPGGAEDSDYLSRTRPYGSIDAPLAHVGELRAVAGMTDAAWQRLRTHITALPQPTAVNVNTASLELIQALTPAMREHDAQRIVAARDQRPLQNLAEISSLLDGRAADHSNTAQLQALADVRSDYFLLEGDLDFDGRSMRLQSVIHRHPELGVAVIRRQRNSV